MTRRLRLARAAAALLAAALLAPAGAAAAPPLELSGPTPFPDACGLAGSPAAGSAAEPRMAVDPADPQRVVAVWQQDRFNADGGALSNVVAVSRDGGASFHRVLVPGLSRCTGGAEERTSDPWLSFGPGGELYLASLVFSEHPQNQLIAGPTALVVQRSEDGGEHWGAPVAVQPEDQTYNDREAITADPTRPGHAYYVFVKRYGADGESGIEQLSRTTDGGRTWSAPLPIYTPPPGTLTDPTLIEVLPDGSLLNLLIVANLSPFLPAGVPRVDWQVVAQRSTDEGRTWSGAQTIAQIYPAAPADAASGKVVRAYPVISTAVAPDGSAYVVWNEIAPGGGSAIRLARSPDGGRTWAAPADVMRTSAQAFLPSVAVDRDGAVAVTWDDTRGASAEQPLRTDVWARISHDAGASWHEEHLGGPFDAETAPESDSAGVQGLFVGDYQGLTALGPGRGFGAVFAQARPQATNGPSDLFFARFGQALSPAGPERPGPAAARHPHRRRHPHRAHAPRRSRRSARARRRR